MDADGNCLVVSPCELCRFSKNGVQACIVRKHNARLTCVTLEKLTSRHRQCVKPDQAMTIFKLVDRDTGEESVEYAPDMVFQRPCDGCQHLKSCIMAGHGLKDWTAEEDGNRLSKRKSPSAGKSSKRSGTSRGEGTIRDTASRRLSGSYAGAHRGKRAPTNEREEAEIEVEQRNGNGQAFANKTVDKGATKRRKMGVAHGSAAQQALGETKPCVPRHGQAGDSALSKPAALFNASAASIASQLDAMAAAEDLLLRQFHADLRNLDAVEASKVKEMEEAKKALEKIRLARKATKDRIAEQRKQMAAERERLTQLRLQEVIRQEAKLRQEKEALWSACEAAATDLPGTGEAIEAAMATAAAGDSEAANGDIPPDPEAGSGQGSAMGTGASVTGFDVVSPWPYFQARRGSDAHGRHRASDEVNDGHYTADSRSPREAREMTPRRPEERAARGNAGKANGVGKEKEASMDSGVGTRTEDYRAYSRGDGNISRGARGNERNGHNSAASSVPRVEERSDPDARSTLDVKRDGGEIDSFAQDRAGSPLRAAEGEDVPEEDSSPSAARQLDTATGQSNNRSPATESPGSDCQANHDKSDETAGNEGAGDSRTAPEGR